MKTELNALFEEAIRLELCVAELYLLFHHKYPEDATFWWELALEEENHAALLRTARQMSESMVQVPADLLLDNLEELRQSIRFVEKAKEEARQGLSREQAFNFALHVENLAGEFHYNSFMKKAPETPVTAIFKKLNGMDTDHAQRIREYMDRHQIVG
jgi:hypothetical protein